MKFIDYNGETVALFLAPPNWENNVDVSLSLIADVTRSLTAQESRRKFGPSSRYTLEYDVRVPTPIGSGEEAAFSTGLRLWLQRLKGETVAVPMWTDGVIVKGDIAAGNTEIPKTSLNPVQYGAEWIVIKSFDIVYTQLLVNVSGVGPYSLADLEPPNPTVDYEIVTIAAIDDNKVTLASPLANDWTDGTIMFPLLFGRVAERPKFDAETDELLTGRIKFQEDSPYARRLNIYPGTVPQVGAGIPEFAAKPLWDIAPDESVKSIDNTEVDLLLSQIGFGRESQVQVYPQPVRRGLQLHVYADNRNDIARVSRMFSDRGGTTKTFMFPTFRNDLKFSIFDELMYGPEPGTAIEPG